MQAGESRATGIALRQEALAFHGHQAHQPVRSAPDPGGSAGVCRTDRLHQFQFLWAEVHLPVIASRPRSRSQGSHLRGMHAFPIGERASCGNQTSRALLARVVVARPSR